jgi:cell volume regulation protein A
MNDVRTFGLILLVTAGAALLAVLSNRVSTRTRIPAPAIFLVAAAAASDIFPSLNALSFTTVERVVTVALAVILFDGGMHLGWRRFRVAAGAITWIGVAGTAVTAAAVAALAHLLFGFDWRAALLLGTALAPTDPAVVFSVLGRREISGRAGTIIEGESGANDPVGIALMAALLTASGTGGSLVLHGIWVFLEQMVIGGAIGVVGGAGLLALMRKVPLPDAGLYPLRTLAGAITLYGVASVAHGSGFLAVFVAGIMIGNARAPYKAEIERFHSALASLGEIVAFTVLGLTITLHTLPFGDGWLTGLVLAALLAFVVRPVLVGLLSLTIRLKRPERLFVLWSGLKGAVPILLGTFVITAGAAHSRRIYEVIFVVVLFSVVVQGGLLPTVAHRLGVPMRVIEPEPWSLGVRLRHEPRGIRRYVVAPGSAADGCEIGDLPVDEDVWVSLVTRRGELIPVRGDAVLEAGDEVVTLTDPERDHRDPTPVFTEAAPEPDQA